MTKGDRVLKVLRGRCASLQEIAAETGLDTKQVGNVLNILRLQGRVRNDGRKPALWQRAGNLVPRITLSAWAISPSLLKAIEEHILEVDAVLEQPSTELLADIRRLREYLGEGF